MAARKFSKSQLARDAGLSLHQKRQALRVANIQEDVFEELIESDNPPTLNQLAKLGRQPNGVILGEAALHSRLVNTAVSEVLRIFRSVSRIEANPQDVAELLAERHWRETVEGIPLVLAYFERLMVLCNCKVGLTVQTVTGKKGEKE